MTETIDEVQKQHRKEVTQHNSYTLNGSKKIKGPMPIFYLICTNTHLCLNIHI